MRVAGTDLRSWTAVSVDRHAFEWRAYAADQRRRIDTRRKEVPAVLIHVRKAGTDDFVSGVFEVREPTEALAIETACAFGERLGLSNR